MQILTVAALIVIGILLFELIIFSHEFGHFITAKLSGVKVNEFALGMGPKIISFVKGETRYSLRLFPIGGYCAMEGEDEDSEEKGAFNNAKVWKRMIIIIAGAVMNILLGFVMMFAFTVQADSYSSTTISQFQPNAFTANTGLQTGDKIVEVNGYSIWNSRDLQFAISTLPYDTVEGNTLEVYKERATSAACGVYNEYAKDESLSKDELQKYYNALSEGCSKINKAASKDEAKKLLDEAGYKDTNGDGIREDKNGKPFKIKFASMSGGAIAEPIAQYYIQQWKQIGLDVELTTGRLIEFNSFYEKVKADDPEIDIYQAAWGTGTNPNPTGLYGRKAQFNYPRFATPELDKILDKINSFEAVDKDYRSKAYKEFANYMFENVPVVPTLFRKGIVAVNNRVKKWDTTPGKNFGLFDVELTKDAPVK